MKALVKHLVILVFSLGSVLAQNAPAPIIVHPLIGDTLDSVERETYRLFPHIEEFVSAVFFLNPDSTLHATVTIVRESVKSTVEVPKYRSLHSLRFHIDQVERINRGIALDPVEEFKKGNDLDPALLPPEEQRITLVNGSVVMGTMLTATRDSIVVRSPLLGTDVKIAMKDVESIEPSQRDGVKMNFWMWKDPNVTQSFIMPTAHTLPAGSGQVGVYQIIFFTVAFGLTDNVMIDGGFLISPLNLEYQPYHFGLKIGFGEVARSVAIGVGAQFLSVPSASTYGFGYGAVSLGDADGMLNIGIGSGFDATDGDVTNPIGGLSGHIRLSENVKLLTELWVLPESEIQPFIIGVRFFGKNLSGDLGMMYLLGARFSSPWGFPVLNLIYSF